MNFPENLNYTKSHEWVKKLDDGTVEIGLSDYAQKELGDIVFVNLPHVGDSISAGATFADVESVKAVADIYSPISGTVKAVNEVLMDQPELLNKEPYNAWLIRAEGDILEGELLPVKEYRALISL
ncbi:MAG: glycine cleavage system protein GcvH [Treponema sp.]|nr:glycine cleavage system protein GcvH [Treponema sp.]